MEYHENEPAEFQIDDSYSVPVSSLIYRNRYIEFSKYLIFINWITIHINLGCGYCGIRNYVEGCY